jgi:hypothetical protein
LDIVNQAIAPLKEYTVHGANIQQVEAAERSCHRQSAEIIAST